MGEPKEKVRAMFLEVSWIPCYIGSVGGFGTGYGWDYNIYRVNSGVLGECALISLVGCRE